MPRIHHYELPLDTSLFSATQLLPRALLSLSMRGWAGWVREHLVSFSSMVRDYKTSVVVLGANLDFVEPFRFIDAEQMSVAFRVSARKGGAFVAAESEFTAGERVVARVQFLMKPVLMSDTESFSAVPGNLPDSLLSKFQSDEVSDSIPERLVAKHQAATESAGRLVGKASHPIVFYRHHCEVAEQWSYIEVPSHAAGARESMALAQSAERPEMRAALSRPLKAVYLELKRPFYLFDRGAIETSAYEVEGGMAFVHEIRSEIGGRGVHGTVFELLQ